MNSFIYTSGCKKLTLSFFWFIKVKDKFLKKIIGYDKNL